jgi:hypothetical protein
VRLYDHLFAAEFPDEVPEGVDWKSNLNPKSLEVVAHAQARSSLRDAQAGDALQFERVGYFFVDPIDSKPKAPVFKPHGDPARQLGEDREARRGIALGQEHVSARRRRRRGGRGRPRAGPAE